jgi:hypothetical protein
MFDVHPFRKSKDEHRTSNIEHPMLNESEDGGLALQPAHRHPLHEITLCEQKGSLLGHCSTSLTVAG